MLFERLIKELRQEKSKIEKMIMHGQIGDFATFKFLIGKANGFDDAIEILKETFKRYDDE